MEALKKVEDLKKQLTYAKGKRRLNSLLELCSMPAFFGSPGELNYIEQAKKEAIIAGNDSALAKTMYLIAEYWWKNDNWKQSERFTTESIKLYEKADNLSGLATAIARYGLIYAQRGNINDATKQFNKALQIQERIADKKGIAITQSNIGLAYLLHGNYSEALRNLLISLHYAQEIDDSHSLGYAYNNIGSVHQHIGNYTEALNNLFLAIENFKKIGYRYALALAYASVGAVYNRLGDFEKALGYNADALIIFKEIKSNRGTANAHFNIGNIYTSKGQTEKALENYQLALKLFEKLADQRGIASTAGNIGLSFSFLGKYTEALEYLEKAVVLSKEVNAKIYLKEAMEELFLIYKKLGQFEKALKYYEQFHQVDKEILGEQSQKQLNQLSFQHNLEQKEKEAEIHRLKNVELEEKNRLIQKEKEEAEFQRRRAEQSERFKQMFLANMSHEIRTPMNAIMGMTNLLLTEPQTGTNLRYLNAIKHSADNLLLVINDVLDLSKIEAGKLKIEQYAFNIYEQLEMLREMFELKAKEKRLRLEIIIEAGIPVSLSGDARRLNQVLLNLLGNAVKFTHKGKITLSLSKEDANRYRFSVKDTGIGIAANMLETIFDSFTQAEGDTTRKYGGTGLGLTISKRLVEMMGGEMKVTSEPGKGSVFSFVIPLIKAANKLADINKGRLEGLSKQLTGVRILLAEDNEYNRVVAVDTLKKFIPGVLIEVAKNGKQALQRLKANDFDIILMDIHMPVMDGYEATEHIRRDLPIHKRNIPIVALTASVIRTDIERCLQCGMNGYVSKPFSPEELLGEISKQLNQNNARETGLFSRGKGTDNKNIYPSETAVGGKSQKYIRLFLRHAPQHVRNIDKALKQRDAKALCFSLHTLRPQVKYMGMEKTAGKIEGIEAKLREQSSGSKLPVNDILKIQDEIKSAIKKFKKA